MRTPTTRNSRPGQRVKAAAPRPAAAPGMGSLLKWTIGAGRDMSSLFDNNDTGDRADHIIAGHAAPGPGAVPNQLLPPFLTIASVQ